jgi:seryl-tRNA synthetase
VEGWDLAKVVGLAAGITALAQLLIMALLRPVLFFALDQRYAAKKDVEAIEGLFVRADDRWGEVEDRVKELEIHSKNEWKRIGEQMSNTANTLQEVTNKLHKISEDNVRLMERWDSINRPNREGTG